MLFTGIDAFVVTFITYKHVRMGQNKILQNIHLFFVRLIVLPIILLTFYVSYYIQIIYTSNIIKLRIKALFTSLISTNTILPALFKLKFK